MKSKFGHTTSLAASLLLLVLLGAACKAKENTMVQSASSSQNGIAVVELFTSEGCSSCPPADAAVAKLLSQQKENVFILGFHVDYWNRLGWTDSFSKAQFTNRQRAYAKALSLESTYTPQVVVNGTTEFVGSDEKRLANAVDNALHKEVANLNVQAERTGDAVTIKYQTKEKDAVINAALVQPEAVTKVGRGENGGRTLHHVNVVRAFISTNANGSGSLTLLVPKELSSRSVEAIVYLQQKKSGAVIAATQKTL